MAGEFTGWPEQAFDVLLQLDGEPSTAVRERCRKDRERLVREPMIALLQDVADADAAYDDFSVWGYGSTAWWWQHQCAAVRMGPVELGLRFDLDGLWATGGWSHPGPGQVEQFRRAVDDDDSGTMLEKLVQTLQEHGFELSGDVMKRIPRGFAAEHSRGRLLRHRSLGAIQPLGCDDWLHTPKAADRVLDAYAQLRPLVSWFDKHVSAQ